eukprot:SM000153S01603  [mRNA]  locus=s153:323513:326130:+ [translate_table: standard]
MHELSFTGAPLAVVELAGEMVGCGATVDAVVLNRRGAALKELSRRHIGLIKDKGVASWDAAMNADVVIVGSAASVAWIGPFLLVHGDCAHKLVWWLMENRQEYYEMAKPQLHKVGALVFISKLQSRLWHSWAQQDRVKLPAHTGQVHLSISEDLARMTGIAEGMDKRPDLVKLAEEKRKKLRSTVRKMLGLSKDDWLLVCLSSVNPGKGQLQLIRAVRMTLDMIVWEGRMMEEESEEGAHGAATSSEDSGTADAEADVVPAGTEQAESEEGATEVAALRRRRLLEEQTEEQTEEQAEEQMEEPVEEEQADAGAKELQETVAGHEEAAAGEQDDDAHDESTSIRPERGLKEVKQESGSEMTGVPPVLKVRKRKQLKLLIGSMGCKSNKAEYLAKLQMELGERRKDMANMVFWADTTAKVAPLYAAADAYVMNAQGLGETFGRVTVEAMAFGLPILGTSAGGTREIVINNSTGLLHPVGKKGVPVLAEHIKYFLEHSKKGVEMGQTGKQRVLEHYRDGPMYEAFGRLLQQVMVTTEHQLAAQVLKKSGRKPKRRGMKQPKLKYFRSGQPYRV